MASESDTTTVANPVESGAPKTLGVADFRKAKERPRKVVPVTVADLGGVVYVRELSALEKDRLDDTLTDDRGKPVIDLYRAKWFVACACDADGKSLFGLTPATLAADVAEIGSWGLLVVEPVYDAAIRLEHGAGG